MLVLSFGFYFLGTETNLYKKLFTNIDYDDEDIELTEENERPKNIDAHLWVREIENAIPLLGISVDEMAEMLGIEPDAYHTKYNCLTERKIVDNHKFDVFYHTEVYPAEERSHRYFCKKGVKINIIDFKMWINDEDYQYALIDALVSEITARGWKDESREGYNSRTFTMNNTSIVICPETTYVVSAVISNK